MAHKQFCYFCAVRLRVCVCYMLEFGAGGLQMPITHTRSLILVVLCQCLSDFTIRRLFVCFFLLLSFFVRTLVFQKNKAQCPGFVDAIQNADVAAASAVAGVILCAFCCTCEHEQSKKCFAYVRELCEAN